MPPISTHSPHQPRQPQRLDQRERGRLPICSSERLGAVELSHGVPSVTEKEKAREQLLFRLDCADTMSVNLFILDIDKTA